MPEAVTTPADASAAPAPPTEPVSYTAGWTADERRTWSLTGEEPSRLKVQTPETPTPEPETPKTPAPEKAKVEPEAGTGEEDEDHEPEYTGSAEQVKAQKRAFARLRSEKAELKAELKLLREQLTVKPAAPVAAPKAEPKTEALSEPELPNIADFDDVKEYHEAMKQFHKDLRAFDRQEAARERESESAAQEQRRLSSAWQAEVAAAKEEHEDFEQIAFNPRVPASLPMIGVIMRMKGGAEVFYHLGKNPELARELTAETDIPGEYGSYEDLARAAEKNSKLARLLGAAEGVVRAEAKRILTGSKKDPDPKPIIKTKAPTPGTRVNATTQAHGDPVEDAYARGDFALGAKLEAARDVERRKRTLKG